MFEAEGFYRERGTRSASRNLIDQIPLIAKHFPEIESYHRGTINVRFKPMLIAGGWDCRTPPLQWDRNNPEVFDLIRVRLFFKDLGETIKAIMYVAHRSAHRLDPHTHEFLGERFVGSLRDSMSVIMKCDHPSLELPYTEQIDGGGGRSEPRLARTFIILPNSRPDEGK
jgi:hypothetical protein